MENNTILAALSADIPLLLWGPPGIGKTATVETLAQESGAHLETLIGSTLEPSDACGYPVPHKGELTFSAPPWARRLAAALAAGKKAWLFLDELSCASPAVQAALLRVVQSRRVGDLDLRGCRILAAANRAEHAADGGWLSAAASNRWAHQDFPVPTVEFWSNGEAANWGGASLTRSQAEAVSLVTGYLRRNSNAFLSLPKVEAETHEAWPSPRSWSAAIKLLAAATPENSRESLVACCVGAAAAAEWAEWLGKNDLPDPEQILAGKPIPGDLRGDQLALVLESTATLALCQHPDQETRIQRAWELLDHRRMDLVLNAAGILRTGAPDIPSPVAEKIGLALGRVV